MEGSEEAREHPASQPIRWHAPRVPAVDKWRLAWLPFREDGERACPIGAGNLSEKQAAKLWAAALQQVKSSEVHLHGYSSAFPRTRTRPAVSQLCFETFPYPHLPHGYLPTVL